MKRESCPAPLSGSSRPAHFGDFEGFRYKLAIVSFEIVRTSGPVIPLIVEVPHSSILLDPESLALCTAPAASIGRDADLYVDELFQDAPALGATLIVSRLSRYVTDLNRRESDLDSQTTPGGTSTAAPHGVVWRRSTDGRPAISAPLPASEIERRLDLLYRPYHQALGELLDETCERFGHVLLLSGHSMPSFGRLGERRADVVPGSLGKTTTRTVYLDCAEKTAQRFRFDVAHDEPYRGGYTTERYGAPERGRSALQIELARRLYMDEHSLSKIPNDFEATRNFCSALIADLGQAAASQSASPSKRAAARPSR